MDLFVFVITIIVPIKTITIITKATKLILGVATNLDFVLVTGFHAEEVSLGKLDSIVITVITITITTDLHDDALAITSYIATVINIIAITITNLK